MGIKWSHTSALDTDQERMSLGHYGEKETSAKPALRALAQMSWNRTGNLLRELLSSNLAGAI
jgi:hypothetical protein